MKIADISVSRVHAFIRINKGNLTLEDNGSKFGTLVKMKGPHNLITLN
jgi:pSer/pThr/pTyr-binding forkhead associated (FHA) protein